MAKIGGIISVVYVLLGLYFVNRAFNVVALPASITSVDKWIFGIAGVLLLLGAYFFSKYNKTPSF